MTRLLTIILIFAALMAKADLGPPSIQAICRVTTSDGKTYEGFVTLIIGGLHGIHQNGFYLYEDDHYNWTVFFDYEFNKLERTGKTKYRIGTFVPDAKEIYFLACVWDKDNYWLTETKQKTREKNENFLITKTVIQRKYMMLDTLPLFTELPKYLHLDYKDNNLKRFNIPMRDIVSFEVVLQPTGSLLNEIEKKRKICFAEPDPTGDFVEPTWVHELIKQPAALKHLREDFEKWHRK